MLFFFFFFLTSPLLASPRLSSPLFASPRLVLTTDQRLLIVKSDEKKKGKKENIDGQNKRRRDCPLMHRKSFDF